MPKITLNIEAGSVQDLKDCIEQFLDNPIANTTGVKISSENGKGRPKKVTDAGLVETKPQAPKIDFLELRTEAMNKALDKGQNKVADIITSFGSDSLSGIPEEQYPELMAKLKAL